ncbi:MAG: AbrB/MazE/SpoVT family DNA-binding domain-containing protein [Pseudomonadota bacterium]|nr:AbrB/MazE/SpoVT family DNA-binding domain-containing protein [Pseudomonadota bacterium]
MTTAKLFTHGGSQAVRLPKEFRFQGREVHVRRIGNDVVLSAVPPGNADALIEALDAFDHGAPMRREQPLEQDRVTVDV